MNKGGLVPPFCFRRGGSTCPSRQPSRSSMNAFKIEVPQATLEKILSKVRDYEWHEMPRGEGLEGSWAYGANLDYMKSLCAYWVDGYDWRKWEKALNAFPQ